MRRRPNSTSATKSQACLEDPPCLARCLPVCPLWRLSAASQLALSWLYHVPMAGTKCYAKRHPQLKFHLPTVKGRGPSDTCFLHCPKHAHLTASAPISGRCTEATAPASWQQHGGQMLHAILSRVKGLFFLDASCRCWPAPVRRFDSQSRSFDLN